MITNRPIPSKRDVNRPIRIVLANGGAELQAVLPAVLSSGRVECVGVATQLDELITLYGLTRPDVVVMDIRFEAGLRGRGPAMRLCEAYPRVPIVLCSPYEQTVPFMKRLESAAMP